MSEVLLDAAQLEEHIDKMATAIAQEVQDPNSACILGIRTRGAVLGQRIHEAIAEKHGKNIRLGILDITLYRDDLSQLDVNPIVRRTQVPFELDGLTVYLVDDVLYTGRTVRSAINEIMDFGRPAAIRLHCLAVRDGRELPIEANFAPLQVQTRPEQVVKVCLEESDGSNQVLLTTREEAAKKISH